MLLTQFPFNVKETEIYEWDSRKVSGTKFFKNGPVRLACWNYIQNDSKNFFSLHVMYVRYNYILFGGGMDGE